MTGRGFAFAEACRAMLRELGGFDLTDTAGYPLAIGTRAGLLRLNPDPSGVLFCRFETPAAARACRVSGPLNEHSGKWNHYANEPPTPADVERMRAALRDLLPPCRESDAPGFRVAIDLANAAFHPSADEEVCRILRGIADRIEADDLESEKVLRDANGNHVGRAWIHGG